MTTCQSRASRASAPAAIAWIPAVFLFAAVVSTSSPAAEAPASALASLPEDTILAVQFSGVDQLLRKIKSSPLYGLKDRAEFQVLAQLTKEASGAKETIGFDPMDLLGCFRGEVVLAVGNLGDLAGRLGAALSMGEAPELSGEDIPFAIVADAGGQSAKVDEYLEKLYALAEKEGAIRESIAVGDAKITVLVDASAGKGTEEGGEDEKGAEGGSKAQPFRLYFGSLGARRYASTSRKFLEGVLARRPGAGSLLENPLFAESRKFVGSGDVFVFANVKQLTNSIGSALSSTFFSLYWQRIERIIFGRSFHNVAWSFTFEDRGVRTATAIHNSGADDGMLGLFKGEGFAPAPPRFIPKTSAVFSSFSFSPPRLGSAIEEIFQLVMSFQDPTADLEKFFSENVGVGFKTFVASLGSRVHYFAEDFSAEQPLGSFNYLIELKDPAPVRTALGKLLPMLGQAGKPEAYKGNDVFIVPFGDQGELAVSATRNLLIVAGKKNLLQTVVDRAEGADEGLGADPEVKKVIGSIAPPEVASLAYVGKGFLPQYIQAFTKTAKENVEALEPGAVDLLGLLEAAANVFGAGVQYGQWTDKGYRGESVFYYR
ncbi:MAG: hypothetical protein ACUVYA_14055 [Planctomycetota bacterium]